MFFQTLVVGGVSPELDIERIAADKKGQHVQQSTHQPRLWIRCLDISTAGYPPCGGYSLALLPHGVSSFCRDS